MFATTAGMKSKEGKKLPHRTAGCACAVVEECPVFVIVTQLCCKALSLFGCFFSGSVWFVGKTHQLLSKFSSGFVAVLFQDEITEVERLAEHIKENTLQLQHKIQVLKNQVEEDEKEARKVFLINTCVLL